MKSRWSSWSRCTGIVVILGALPSACGADFDTTRVVPQRSTIGRELYSLVCDRVGTQALREDVTASSYHSLCHPDAAGAYGARVDTSLLVPLDPAAVDKDGRVVPLEQQKKHRAYRVARIEALAKRREDLVFAFDAAFPDAALPVKDAASCKDAGLGKLHKELAGVLSRLTDLENDRTIPLFTEALARIMNNVRSSPDAQAALARFDARQGYRPSDIALGAARPALAYPRLVPLVNAFLKLVATDSDPWNPAGRIDPKQPLGIDNRKPIAGKASAEFQQLLSVMHEELRTAETPTPLAPLGVKQDPQIPTRKLLSRPRTTLELTRAVLLTEDAAFDIGTGSARTRYIARRDPRGFVSVPLTGGALPAPFVDLTGPDGKPDGLPDLDPLGRFVVTGALPASPFFSVDAVDGPRDPLGRALGQQNAPLYDYIDTTRTFLASTTRDIKPLLDPDPTKEAVMKLLAGAPIVFGQRDQTAATTKSYAPDPSRSADWALAHRKPAPPGIDTSPVTVAYRGFKADTSPIVDLVYALGQLLADPAMDDLLELGKKLVTDHPGELARLIGIGLQIKQIADAHPEAKIPESSLLWDELLDTIGKISSTPGILEDLILAFKKPETAALQDTFGAYIEFKDELAYDKNNLNGPAFNVTANAVTGLKTPVDRSAPDVGTNRSALQKFMQLLHDANGLAACTKDNAIVPIDWNGVKIHYPPQNAFETLALGTVCAFTGNAVPTRLNACGVLRFENVAALLLDVALGRAQFDVRDPCLKAIMNSPLTGIVGGVDAFLEQVSGIKGFSTHPTVSGVARMVYVDTPHDGLPGDTTPAMKKTIDFMSGVLDPVPATVCPLTPFTDPTDGKIIPLRKCATFADTLRGRDPNALFPLEQNDFIKNVQALAAAFADHNQPLLFVELFDTLHRHWGSDKQPKTVCDPSLPKTDARWCSQDGAVSYEPLLVEVMRKTDLFKALMDTVPVIEQTVVKHCDTQDPTTHACTKTSDRNGVAVLAEAVRTMTDPARNVGLKDRRGNTFALRNDGAKNPQVTKMYLFIDALKGIDALFAASPEGGERLPQWRSARSQLVDTFLSVKGTGKASTFANPALPKILPVLLDAVQAQLLAHCPDRSSADKCAWGQKELADSLASTVSGPTFAAVIDLLDALRKDDGARVELEKLLQYLLDPASENDAQATTLAAIADILQALSDDTNLAPLFRAIADAAGGSWVDDDGKVVRRALLDASIETLSRIFAPAKDEHGAEQCSVEIDPNQVIAVVMKKMVTPMAPNRPTPIETIIDVVADVNRAAPGDPSKLAATDYANMANEISDFCLDKGRGLEQVYEVIREATLK